jgi:hypothetical protein
VSRLLLEEEESDRQLVLLVLGDLRSRRDIPLG